MTRRHVTAAVAVAVLAVGGCGPARMNSERAFDFASGENVVFGFPPQSAAQTVKVDITSDKAVDVFALLNVPLDDANGFTVDKAKAKAAGSKTKVTADSFTVQVPAGQELVVWVGVSDFGTRAKGTVKLTN
jgi:hypothetical protein